jgi:SAM-dependent methyltransferase
MERMSDRDMGHVDYDAELRLHNDALRRAYEIGPEDRVLDIGCGAGQTTRDAARLASAGWAIGVDISKEMIGRADLLAEAEGLHNVAFERADAQDHPFPTERFDLAISRFGTMFFRDPVAAFTNIGRGLRRDGRLLMMVWQGHERNEWSVSIERLLRPPSDRRFRFQRDSTLSRWPIRRRPGRSWTRPASPTSRSPACVSPSTTVGTLPPRSRGSVVSPAPRTRWIASIPPGESSRSNACARRSSLTLGGTASGSTRAPGS